MTKKEFGDDIQANTAEVERLRKIMLEKLMTKREGQNLIAARELITNYEANSLGAAGFD